MTRCVDCTWVLPEQFAREVPVLHSYVFWEKNEHTHKKRKKITIRKLKVKGKKNTGKLTVTAILNSLRTFKANVDSDEQMTILYRYNALIVELLLNWKLTVFNFPRAKMRAIPETWRGMGWVITDPPKMGVANVSVTHSQALMVVYAMRSS